MPAQNAFFFFKSLFNYEERGQRQAKTSKRTYTHLQLTANVRDCVKIQTLIDKQGSPWPNSLL